MDFSHMIDSISKCFDIDVLQIGSKEKIDDIKLLTQDIDEWKSNTLYIGHSTQLDIPSEYPLQIIVCGKINKDKTNNSMNIALINENDLFSVFNKLSSIFYYNLKLASEFSMLVAMLMRGESVSSIMNESANRVKNPIIIVDTSFHVLCYSDNYPITDPFWKVNIKRGYCTYEFITAVNEIISKQDTPEDSGSYIVNCPASPNSKLCSKILWNNHVVGYTIMLEEYTPLQDFQMDFLPKISYIVADMLSKDPSFDTIHGSNSEHILYNLLSGEDELNIRARINAAKLVFPDNMRCIVARNKTNSTVESKIDKKQLLRLYKDKLLFIFPNSYCTYYQNNIILIAKVDSTTFLTTNQENELNELMLDDNFCLGISQCITNIYELRHFYEQVLRLIDIANKAGIKKTVMYHEHYIFEDILNRCSTTHSLIDLVHPALKILKLYDKQNDGSLYETLQVYLSSRFNLKQTASKLFIHRNSLTYRMDKILELTKLNLEDMNTLFWLEMSYRIETFTGTKELI